MVEYGTTVGQSTGVVAGGGSGGFDPMGSFQQVIDRIASLPPEVLLLGAIALLGGLLILRRA